MKKNSNVRGFVVATDPREEMKQLQEIMSMPPGSARDCALTNLIEDNRLKARKAAKQLVNSLF